MFFFWSDKSWLLVLLLAPPPIESNVWCHISPVRFLHPARTVIFILPYGPYPNLGGGGTTHQLIWLVLLPFSNKEGSFFCLHSLKIAIAGNIAGIYFGGACFQAFTQDRTGFVLHTVRYFCETSFTPYGFHLYTTTTVLWNSTPYGTSSKPWFSPYGFHLYTTTTVLWNSTPYGTSSKLDSSRTGFICTQLPYGPFEFTGRYNTSLSPPRGPYGLCFAYRTVLLRNFIQPVRVSFVHKYI